MRRHERGRDERFRVNATRRESGPESASSQHGVLRLQRLAGNAAVEELLTPDRVVPRDVGRPLEPAVQREMEAKLGHDLSAVRLHEDADAAGALNAHAYTVGTDIVFAPGMYEKRRLAHELVHVVQQASGRVEGTEVATGVTVSEPADRHEREASTAADRMVAGKNVSASRERDASHNNAPHGAESRTSLRSIPVHESVPGGMSRHRAEASVQRQVRGKEEESQQPTAPAGQESQEREGQQEPPVATEEPRTGEGQSSPSSTPDPSRKPPHWSLMTPEARKKWYAEQRQRIFPSPSSVPLQNPMSKQSLEEAMELKRQEESKRKGSPFNDLVAETVAKSREALGLPALSVKTEITGGATRGSGGTDSSFMFKLKSKKSPKKDQKADSKYPEPKPPIDNKKLLKEQETLLKKMKAAKGKKKLK